MSKIKTNKKQINEGFKNKICCGYCDLQYLLYYKEADFYNSGVYGWNCDIYKIDNNTVIVTGYRPYGNIRNYKLVREFDQKAKNIVKDNNIEYETKIKLLDELIVEFVEEIKKGDI